MAAVLRSASRRLVVLLGLWLVVLVRQCLACSAEIGPVGLLRE